jgi:hypothetical protein
VFNFYSTKKLIGVHDILAQPWCVLKDAFF